MRKEDLKVGMVVNCVSERTGTGLAFVTESKQGICISGENHWVRVSDLSDDLTYMTLQITEVYDLCEFNRYAYELSTDNRTCLWERKKVKKVKKVKELTVGEIERELGYPIKIVGEH